MSEYKELAAKLGDITYKLLILKQQRKEILKQIKRLDVIVGAANEKKNQTS
jgi:hypothetical protein